MGLVPRKLNNTGNQIGYSGSQYRFYKRISNVIRKATYKRLNEQRILFFRGLEDSADTVYHGSYDNPEGFSKRDVL